MYIETLGRQVFFKIYEGIGSTIFFNFSSCLTIVLGRNKFDCTLENLPPFVNVNVLPMSTAYCRTFYDSTSSKVRIISGKSWC